MLTERVNTLHWGWMIFTEMFLAGIAAGLILCALLLTISGRGRSPAARTANLLAFPIMLVVTVLLIVDLNRPERFWHMVLMSERFLPIFKPWSPISLGTWLIISFTGVNFVSFLVALLAAEREGSDAEAGLFQLFWSGLGALLGMAVAIYSGVLLTATNIPGWADAPLIAAVYAASAPVTGIALLVLIQSIRGRVDADVFSLAATNTWLIGFWVLITAIFVVTLLLSYSGVERYFLYGWPPLALFGAVVLGGVVPLLLRPRALRPRSGALIISSALVLLGGLLLRMSIVLGPQDWIH